MIITITKASLALARTFFSSIQRKAAIDVTEPNVNASIVSLNHNCDFWGDIYLIINKAPKFFWHLRYF
jgi:hypothetical protein